MPYTAQQIEEILRSRLQAEQVSVTDMSDGCGSKFDVNVVAEGFRGKRPLERHRMVNEALMDEMKEIHALTIKATPPEQPPQQQQPAPGT